MKRKSLSMAVGRPSGIPQDGTIHKIDMEDAQEVSNASEGVYKHHVQMTPDKKLVDTPNW